MLYLSHGVGVGVGVGAGWRCWVQRGGLALLLLYARAHGPINLKGGGADTLETRCARFDPLVGDAQSNHRPC